MIIKKHLHFNVALLLLFMKSMYASEQNIITNTISYNTPNEQEIGKAIYKISPQGTCKLDYLAVDPKHKKNGIGSLILNSVEKDARENNCIQIIVGSMPSAVSFYKKHGYSIAPTLKNSNQIATLMKKNITL